MIPKIFVEWSLIRSIRIFAPTKSAKRIKTKNKNIRINFIWHLLVWLTKKLSFDSSFFLFSTHLVTCSYCNQNIKPIGALIGKYYIIDTGF